MLRIYSSSWDWSSGTLFEKLRAFAAKQGCDAVVVVADTSSGYLGSCIQYLDDT